MVEHLTASKMERFSLSALPEVELASITDHLTECQPCHELFAETLRRQRGSEPITFSLEPEYWLRHDHVDFDQLVEIVDNKLDATDQEMLDIHLSICVDCRERVDSIVSFARDELPASLNERFFPKGSSKT